MQRVLNYQIKRLWETSATFIYSCECTHERSFVSAVWQCTTRVAVAEWLRLCMYMKCVCYKRRFFSSARFSESCGNLTSLATSTARVECARVQCTSEWHCSVESWDCIRYHSTAFAQSRLVLLENPVCTNLRSRQRRRTKDTAPQPFVEYRGNQAYRSSA